MQHSACRASSFLVRPFPLDATVLARLVDGSDASQRVCTGWATISSSLSTMSVGGERRSTQAGWSTHPRARWGRVGRPLWRSGGTVSRSARRRTSGQRETSAPLADRVGRYFGCVTIALKSYRPDPSASATRRIRCDVDREWSTGGVRAVPRSCARIPTPRSNHGADGSAGPPVSSCVVP